MKHMVKNFQAKCITDEQIFLAVSKLCKDGRKAWTHQDEVIKLFPLVPRKIVIAKLNQARRKGILNSCSVHSCECGEEFCVAEHRA